MRHVANAPVCIVPNEISAWRWNYAEKGKQLCIFCRRIAEEVVVNDDVDAITPKNIDEPLQLSRERSDLSVRRTDDSLSFPSSGTPEARIIGIDRLAEVGDVFHVHI